MRNLRRVAKAMNRRNVKYFYAGETESGKNGVYNFCGTCSADKNPSKAFIDITDMKADEFGCRIVLTAMNTFK